MKTVTINFILHERLDYFKKTLKELISIDNDIKKDLSINLLVSNTSDDLKNYVNTLNEKGIETKAFLVQSGNNYMDKIYAAFNNSGEYIISIDEDIFIPTNVWNYFISNVNVLDQPENLFLSPIITSGIPSVDLFEDNFLEEEEKEQLHKFYLKTNIPNVWGADYSSLNNHTINSNEWKCENFYNDVYKINHHYKGVHPVRFSYEAQEYLNNICIKKINKFSSINNFSLKFLDRPYFCNSVFAVKKSDWENIIHNQSLFRDSFDEVPLNLYMLNNKLKMVFIENGIAVHPSYNTINIYGHNYKNLSDSFFNGI
jgi:hypothetical protein